MARFLKQKKDSIGLSPDSITFRGEKKIDFVKLRIIDYDSGNMQEIDLKDVSEGKPFDKTKSTSWLNIDGLHDEQIMNQVLVNFDIDPVIISDVLNTDSRPKFQEFDNCIYISLKMMNYDEEKNMINAENLVLLIKENMLITFQERVGDVFDPIRERIRKNKKLIRTSGTDYLAFALIDIVIDNYIYILSRIGEKIEDIDDRLFEDHSDEILEEINEYKREINFMRKIIKPERELIHMFAKTDSDLMDEKVFVHLRELQENINHASESVDSYREILLEQINVYQTTISNRLNDIIKFLTIFSVIFIPLTFIAGIYGMNFHYIPGLGNPMSFFILLGIMGILALGMILYIRFKKWF